MTTINMVLLIFTMICFCAVVVIGFEIPVGGNDVSNPRPLYDSKGRLKKKYLPYIIISLVVGIILLVISHN